MSNQNIITPQDIIAFTDFLEVEGYSSKTVTISKESLHNLHKFLKTHNICDYRNYLMSQYSSSTINLRIYVTNKYLHFKRINFKIKTVPNQKNKTLDKVISLKDYKKLISFLKEDNLEMYLIIKTLASTGMRPSELSKIKILDVKKGYADIFSKCNKQRRIYFPKNLQREILKYKSKKMNKLFDFSMYQLRYALKKCKKLGIDSEVLHPYTFRHFFGKNFIKKSGNLTLLADLMGHESLETTRIYTRLSKEEQLNEINRCVDWV